MDLSESRVLAVDYMLSLGLRSSTFNEKATQSIDSPLRRSRRIRDREGRKNGTSSHSDGSLPCVLCNQKVGVLCVFFFEL